MLNCFISGVRGSVCVLSYKRVKIYLEISQFESSCRGKNSLYLKMKRRLLDGKCLALYFKKRANSWIYLKEPPQTVIMKTWFVITRHNHDVIIRVTSMMSEEQLSSRHMTLENLKKDFILSIVVTQFALRIHVSFHSSKVFYC